MTRTMLIALLSAAVAAPAFAQGPGQPPQGGQGQGGHRGPPQEALDACKGKKDGDQAQVRTPRGDTVSGTCRLVLVPAAGPADGKAPAGGQRKDGPPQR
jgi:hypothetical protein